MQFWDSVKTCFSKYADFTGRASRSEYWWFFLFAVIVQLCLRVLWMPLEIVFGLAVLLPALAVGARRLHDTDRSGWWLLIDFVPFIGWIVLIVWFCQKSDPIANRFGPPPLPAEPAPAATGAV